MIFFSFGVFCHISPPLIREYLLNLFPKMRRNSHAFFLIADYDKYNYFVMHPEMYSAARAVEDCYAELSQDCVRRNENTHFQPRFIRSKEEEATIDPNRWYHLGIAQAVDFLRQAGFEVVSEDVGINHRDPILHFRKP